MRSFLLTMSTHLDAPIVRIAKQERRVQVLFCPSLPAVTSTRPANRRAVERSARQRSAKTTRDVRAFLPLVRIP